MAVVGEGWNLLIVPDIARGRHQFDQLASELGISRKVLDRTADPPDGPRRPRAEKPYQHTPTRYAYRLTGRGRGCCRCWWHCRTGVTASCSATVTSPPPLMTEDAEVRRVQAAGRYHHAQAGPAFDHRRRGARG